MKLISLNLWQGRIGRNYLGFFKGAAADIICLQEIYTAAKNIPSLEIFRSLNLAQKASDLPYCYFSPVHSYAVMGTEVQFGNAILSRLPFSSQKTVFTSGRFNNAKSPDQYADNVRNAQIVSLDIRGQKLYLVNHHGYWESTPNGSRVSTEKLQLLSRAVKEIDGPFIAAGDFNLSSGSPSMKSFKRSLNLIDLNINYNIENTLSGLVTPWHTDCDHILINKQINPINLQVSDKLLSDHRALIFDFTLK